MCIVYEGDCNDMNAELLELGKTIISEFSVFLGNADFLCSKATNHVKIC